MERTSVFGVEQVVVALLYQVIFLILALLLGVGTIINGVTFGRS